MIEHNTELTESDENVLPHQQYDIVVKESTIESIIGILDKRFEMDTASVLTSILQPINDLQTLRSLFNDALEVDHLEHLIRTFNTIHSNKF